MHNSTNPNHAPIVNWNLHDCSIPSFNILIIINYAVLFQVFQHKDEISEISSQASNEATLEEMLQKVNLALVTLNFGLMQTV